MFKRRQETNVTSDDGSTVVSTTRPFWVRIGKVWTMAIVLVIIVITVGGIGIWRSHNDKEHKIQADKQKFAILNSQIDTDFAPGHFASAAQQWESYAATTPNKSNEVAALNNAAALNINAKNYALALKQYQEMASITGLNYNEAQGAAYADQMLGDNSAAIKYLQEAINLTPSNVTGGSGSQKAVYQQRINALEQSKS